MSRALAGQEVGPTTSLWASDGVGAFMHFKGFLTVRLDEAREPPRATAQEHHVEMESRVAPETAGGRHVSVATVLTVALLFFAVGTGAWVVWQVTADDQAPAAFQERPAPLQCSPITVSQGQSTPTALQDCLLSADAQRDGAEVVVTFMTTEGDPIRTHYRVSPGGGVNVFTDATADSFGSGEWSHVRYPDVAALDSWDSCQPA